MSLREKAEAATPGPWMRGETGTTRNGKPSDPTHVIWNYRGQWSMVSGQGDQAKADAEFIAAADPPTVLALLDRAEKAEAELVHAERCWTDLGNDVLENAPDWFDGDEDQDGIAVRYVRWLEDRVAELEVRTDDWRSAFLELHAFVVSELDPEPDHDPAGYIAEPLADRIRELLERGAG